MSNGVSALALGGAVVVAGSALAFTQKAANDSRGTPVKVEVDERPVAREGGGRTSFAPVVKKVSPGVVKVYTKTKAHEMSYHGPP